MGMIIFFNISHDSCRLEAETGEKKDRGNPERTSRFLFMFPGCIAGAGGGYSTERTTLSMPLRISGALFKALSRSPLSQQAMNFGLIGSWASRGAL